MDMKKASWLLQNKGFKMTKRREDILAFFAKEDKYQTAKDLYEYMETTYPGISFDTVYRNLHLYHDLGILESTDLNAEKHFRMNCGDHHHHHFICNICGKTKKINLCPMDEVEKLLTKYMIDGHKFEVYGLCPTCQIA
ncbi:Fur family transcriptional regulator [Pseudogracilibacillus auburnensis]|uniref:Fur family zinc uptake transcriptional regulator n=1 Tax=Pseudogracilibacillus auburnensis TaxID=1494959 RepID=A0A2V3VGR2_9BACI|nr:Fur family transcriptional regulator [Pseudogracilibacillus auburnensis]PXW80983.1 Fur family zinc uptake transcriptional regulator [Pseudogracilibacillus auburnensis]